MKLLSNQYLFCFCYICIDTRNYNIFDYYQYTVNYSC
jgi:hypothetical protein